MLRRTKLMHQTAVLVRHGWQNPWKTLARHLL